MINRLIVFVAQDVFFVLPILIAIMFCRLPKQNRIPTLLSLVLGGVCALLLAKLAGHFFFDPRPFVSGHVTPLFRHTADNGFPSDHMTFGMTLACISFAYARKWGLVMIPIALLVGAARVLAHVHSWLDIAGGTLVGLIAAIIAVYAGRYVVAKWRHANAHR